MTVACDARYHTELNFQREVFASRVRASLARETHVIVGDHTPEVRDEGLWPDDGLGNMRLSGSGAQVRAMNRYRGQAFKDGPR